MMDGSTDHSGLIRDLIEGRWENPDTGEKQRIPIKEIEIRESLEGMEGDLYRKVHGQAKACLVCDEITYEILAKRVAKAIGVADSDLLVLKNPYSDIETAESLREQVKDHEVLVAVGSGTINDLCKYASFLDGKEYSVYCTSPMNAYSTGTASLVVSGLKKSLPAHSASGVFFDLAILAGCPQRLICNGLADVVCRPTAQVDWLLSRTFQSTPYLEGPYRLLDRDEEQLFKQAGMLRSGDIEALAALTRTCVMNGLGVALVGTTHAGSMGEHMVSHYLDMFADDAHPGSLHGEQVGVATLTLLELQNRILMADSPPELSTLPDEEDRLAHRYGASLGEEFSGFLAAKRLDQDSVDRWNEELGRNWEEVVAPMRAAMVGLEHVRQAMLDAGAITTATGLGFAADFYRDAVRDARCIRDRFTILDLAAHSGVLEDFVASEAVA